MRRSTSGPEADPVGLNGSHTYVGFGFGAIQAGLFLYEAYQSGNFGRLVVAEVVPDLVTALRRSGGIYTVNIAHLDHVEAALVGPVEIYDPAVPDDRECLVEALADAQEIGTAIRSVAGYRTVGAGSLHRLLAQGLARKAARRGPPVLIYAAENHNHAAELLSAAVKDEIPEADRSNTFARVQFLNTVIGKMSGVHTGDDAIWRHDLVTVTPEDRRVFLVEAFNRILISRVDRLTVEGEPFRRGIEVFEEKADLLPFEEAKLYGHNATHALGAYLGAVAGLERFADLASRPGFIPFLRSAFLEESGRALIRRHAGVDRLFTPQGFQEYADDLLARMTNPFLLDTLERVGRDPARKLAWDDRLVGTMRLALDQGIEPRRYALGVAAALAALDRTVLDDPSQARALLESLWAGAAPDPQERSAVLARVDQAVAWLLAWLDGGCGDPERVLGPEAEEP